jgi:hypothetical protein
MMDPAVAAKLVDALDAELLRRRRKRDAEEESRWKAEAIAARQVEREAAAECLELIEVLEDSGVHSDGAILKELISRGVENPNGGPWHVNHVRQLRRLDSDADGADQLYVFAKIVERFTARVVEAKSDPAAGAVVEDKARLRAFEDLVGHIEEIAKRLDGRQRAEEAEVSGVRQPVFIVPRVRAAAVSSKPKAPIVDILAKNSGGDGGGKSAKKSRTDVWREEQEAALAAKQVAIRAAQPPGQEPPQHETIVKIGRVEKYDPRTMSGIVSILGPGGRIELPFPMSSIMRAGITSLHPGQELECTIKKRADGAMLVDAIKLSVGERAAALAELERQAQAAEENYRIELMRRRLD